MPEQSPTMRLSTPASPKRGKVLAGVGSGFLSVVIVLSAAIGVANANPPAPAKVAAATQTAAPAAPVDTKAAAAKAASQRATADQAAKDENTAARKAAKSAAAAERSGMIGDHTTCQSINRQAVQISGATTFPVKLVKVRSPKIVADHRATFTRPTTAKGALVLSCLGTGVLSTGEIQSTLVSVSVNSYGETYIEYQGL